MHQTGSPYHIPPFYYYNIRISQVLLRCCKGLLLTLVNIRHENLVNGDLDVYPRPKSQNKDYRVLHQLKISVSSIYFLPPLSFEERLLIMCQLKSGISFN